MRDEIKMLEELFGDIFGAKIKFYDITDQVKPVANDDWELEYEYEDDVDDCEYCRHFEPVRVIFNKPATIVFWCDGTKTVVKCHKEDAYDTEKGLAMAYMKKINGNNGHFNEILKRWCPYEC